MLKLSRSRSTAHKNAAKEAQKQEELRDEQNGAVKEDSRSEEPEDYATFFLDKLASTCIGVYGVAASGDGGAACLDGRDGPEVENELTVTNTDKKSRKAIKKEAKKTAAARKQAQIEAEKAKKAAQEEESKKKAAARKQAQIEAEQAKKAAQEEEAKKAAARKQAQIEAEQAKKAAQEEEAKKKAAARKQAQIEAEEAKIAELEQEAKKAAAARKQAQIEAALAKEAAQKEEAKKTAAAAARRKAWLETAQGKKVAQAVARKQAEQAERAAQEEAKKTAEMELARIRLKELESDHSWSEASEVTSLYSEDSEGTHILTVLTGGLFTKEQGNSSEVSSCFDEVNELPHLNCTSTESSAKNIPFC